MTMLKVITNGVSKFAVLTVLSVILGTGVGNPECSAASPLPDLVIPPDASGEAGKFIAEAVEVYPHDPVSAYFFLGWALSEKKKLDAVTSEWIAKSMKALKPHVFEILERDKAIALDRSDLRMWYIAATTAFQAMKNDLQPSDWDNVLPGYATLKEKTLAGKDLPDAIWQITDVTGERMDCLTETCLLTNITVTPGDSTLELLRVKANVKNLSGKSDPDYAMWACGTGQATFIWVDAPPDERPKPGRLIIDNFVWLVSGQGKWIPCGYACCNCKALVGKIAALMRTCGEEKSVSGSYLKKDDSFELDVLFSVPKNGDMYRLLILGSPSVPVRTTAK